MGKFTSVFIIIFIVALIFPPTTYAYLDPGTGSYFFQIIIATVLGGIFAVKLFFKKIVNYLKHFLSKDANKELTAK